MLSEKFAKFVKLKTHQNLVLFKSYKPTHSQYILEEGLG